MPDPTACPLRSNQLWAASGAAALTGWQQPAEAWRHDSAIKCTPKPRQSASGSQGQKTAEPALCG